MQVPLPPRSPEVQVSEFSPPRFQVPTTVAPLSGLCAAAWTVISTVAAQVVPSFEGKASRSPMWMLTEGASTEDVVEAWLFAALSSVTLWLGVRGWGGGCGAGCVGVGGGVGEAGEGPGARRGAGGGRRGPAGDPRHALGADGHPGGLV